MNTQDAQIISEATQRAFTHGQGIDKPAAVVDASPTTTGRQINLYVKPADADIWSRARALADVENSSLAAVVADALYTHVPQVEREQERAKEIAEQMEVYTLEGEDSTTKQFRRVRFTGVIAAEHGKSTVYVTRKGQIVVETVDMGNTYVAVFDSFEAFKGEEWVTEELGETIAQVGEAAGAHYAEELD